MVKHLDWHGLYGDGWKGEIVADAFQHPAKYSRALIRHIYEYLIKEKMVKPGDVVLDPFGGVALGGLDAARLGLHFIGCELEEKFVTLGNQNIALWNARYAGKMPRWGSARLVQGDSRHLRSVIAQASAAVPSPPYAASLKGDSKPSESDRQHRINIGRNPDSAGSFNLHGYGMSDGNLGNLKEGDYRAAISSPPYAESIAHDAGGNHKETYVNHYGGGDVPPRCYSDNPANLGNLKGDGYEAAVSSPPYNLPMSQDHNGTRGGKRGTTPAEQGAFVKYGNTDGQIEGLPMSEEGFNAAVSSPPYEGSPISAQGADGKSQDWNNAYREFVKTGDHQVFQAQMTKKCNEAGYSVESDNLGNNRGDDFWSAARQVVAETYAVLAPGAVAVWVTKRFVRGGKIVEFSQQWAQLCEAVGFKQTHWIKAWLVEDNGTQLGFETNRRRVTSRKSFFRRLHEKKYPETAIDWEDVLIMRKPEAAA